MVKVRRNICNKSKSIAVNGFAKRFSGNLTNSKRKRMMSIRSVLIWSLAFFHVLNCCNWVLAGDCGGDTGAPEAEEVKANHGTTFVLDQPIYDWSPSPSLFRSNYWLPYTPFTVKNKRAVYGILGLATKRPHKTAAEIQYLPPQDSFVSVRGRKKRSMMGSVLSSNLPSFETRRRKVSLPEPPLPMNYYYQQGGVDVASPSSLHTE